MKVADIIANKIDRMRGGYVFTYPDLDMPVENREGGIKALNRLVKAGKVKKLSKGRYYKSIKTEFGELAPTHFEVVKDLLEKDGKVIGYITGYGAYNELGLTTQLTNSIQIGKNDVRGAIERGMYKVSFVKQKNLITRRSIPLLKILDSISSINSIPDTTIEQSCTRLKAILRDLPIEDLEYLIVLAVKYSPATRALTGALIEDVFGDMQAESLKKSLNPISQYKLSIPTSAISCAAKWNIK